MVDIWYFRALHFRKNTRDPILVDHRRPKLHVPHHYIGQAGWERCSFEPFSSFDLITPHQLSCHLVAFSNEAASKYRRLAIERNFIPLLGEYLSAHSWIYRLGSSEIQGSKAWDETPLSSSPQTLRSLTKLTSASSLIFS